MKCHVYLLYQNKRSDFLYLGKCSHILEADHQENGEVFQMLLSVHEKKLLGVL